MDSDTTALVRLLREYDPAVLSQLHADGEKAGIAFRDDFELGVRESAAPTSQTALQVRARLARAGLQVVRRRVGPNLDRLRSRLARARTIRLWGNLLAAALSAGVIGALLANENNLAKLSAVLEFLVVSSTLLADHLEAALYGGKRPNLDLFQELARDAADAEGLDLELQAVEEGALSASAAEKLIGRANAVAARLRRNEQDLWGENTAPAQRTAMA
jgi:hypothetical protein